MAKKDETVHLEINCPGKGQVLSILRKFVCGVADEMGFSRDDIAQIEMAVDEACSNVICHAYESEEGPETFKLIVKTAHDYLNIIIQDMGIGNRAGPHKGVEDIREFIHRGHGLGTYIIREFMDKVEVEYPEDSGTTISMIKFISPRDSMRRTGK